jgi:hypothetical protein
MCLFLKWLDGRASCYELYLDVDNWLAWREVCNWLAHEYPDQPEVRFAALMAAIDAAKSMNKKQLSVA